MDTYIDDNCTVRFCNVSDVKVQKPQKHTMFVLFFAKDSSLIELKNNKDHAMHDFLMKGNIPSETIYFNDVGFYHARQTNFCDYDIGRKIKAIHSFAIKNKIKDILVFCVDHDEHNLALLLRQYSWHTHQYKAKKSDHQCNYSIVTDKLSDDDLKAIDINGYVGDGCVLAKELITAPSNVLYPESFCAIVTEKFKGHNVKIKILDHEEISKLGMNLIMAVGGSSHRKPKLLVIEHMGNKASEKCRVLIGKGVTYDTGGLSLKPTPYMEDMKGDMSGAAAVVGAALFTAKAKIKDNLVFICPLVENIISSSAIKPGDVVKAMNGKTVEIMNTDAEGRLILADAICYAQKHYQIESMIDIATLTGAILVALGSRYAGLFANNTDLAKSLRSAGKSSGEELWEMPLDNKDESYYLDILKSDLADIKNCTNKRGSGAGSSTAAQFLNFFVEKAQWAHLDIAGFMWQNKSGYGAGLGFGVRLLSSWIIRNSK